MSKKIIFTAAIAGLLLPYPLAAQNNNILIVEQRGSENTLSVDQSQATNSLVAGSGIPLLANEPNDSSILTLTLADLGLTSTSGATNRSFVVSGDISVVGENDEDLTNTLNSASPATQDGGGNSGNVILAGNGSFAGLEQLGDDNSATINVNGDNAGGIIVQSGNDNNGTVEVIGGGAFGELIQIGNDNNTAFTVSGSPDANVSFTVQGNGIETNVPANVVTDGGQITIVQRQLGSFE